MKASGRKSENIDSTLILDYLYKKTKQKKNKSKTRAVKFLMFIKTIVTFLKPIF